MSMPTSYSTQAASSFTFSTLSGLAAAAHIPTRYNLADYELSMIYDDNSKFPHPKLIGTVFWQDYAIHVHLTAAEVDAMRECFYRILATRNGQTVCFVIGSVEYRIREDGYDSGLLDANGDLKVQFLPPLVAALDEEFLRRDEYVAGVVDPEALRQAVENEISVHVNSATPHPAYDIDAPSFYLIFENGLI